MSLYRRNPRRDLSEPDIIVALRAYGFSVTRLSIPGGPDLLLGKGGTTRVAEAKTGDADLRENQRDWWATWRGNGLIVMRTVEDVAKLARLWR